MRAAPAIVLLAIACGGTAGPQVPVPVRSFRPEDRVLLSDFSRVTALAATFNRIYVAYPRALAIWQPLQQRWDVPRSPPNPAALRDVVGAVADPLDESVWLATRNGWLHYDPLGDQWSGGAVAGPVGAIATDPAHPERGVWIEGAAGWLLVPRVGGAGVPGTPPNTLRYPPTAQQALQDLPQLRALTAQLLTGPRQNFGQFTAAVPDIADRGWYLGTSNRGLVYVPRTGADIQPMPFGLQGTVVGALALDGDAIDVATDADGVVPAGLTAVRRDLSAMQPLAPATATGLPFDAVRGILVDGDSLWLASDHGVAVEVGRGGDVHQWGAAQGLLDQRVLALARLGGQLLAGTMEGLAERDTTGSFSLRDRTMTEPVYALLVHGDTAWVGTRRGLYATLAGDSVLRMSAGFALLPEARNADPVVGIGYIVDTLVAMTRERLLWRDPSTGAWSEGPLLSDQLGPLRGFWVTPHGAWLGGDRGAALVAPQGAVLSRLVVGVDLPDQVTAIAGDGDYLWIGTAQGLVRFQLQLQ